MPASPNIGYVNSTIRTPVETNYSILTASKSMHYFYPPNSEIGKMYHYDGIITPTKIASPSPMGLSDIGLYNNSGHLSAYNVTSSSVMGEITLNSSNEYYLDDDMPNSFSIQLNAVLNNVTLHGTPKYVFWTQNVVVYSVRTHELTFIDNVWNFSSRSSFALPLSTLEGKGKIVSNKYYYYVGPTLNISFPFTLKLYLNYSFANGNDLVYFNYSILNPSYSKSGSYDMVTFNSNSSESGAYYFVSGYVTSPSGLLNDAELVIGGPGGGSNANFYSINGTMSLYLFNETAHAYEPVKSAYDYGFDTGETSYGVNVGWSNHTAKLTGGPSLLYGMWNVSASERIIKIEAPSGSFVFISPGSEFNNTSAVWAPLNGINTTFYAASGSYSAAVLKNYYKQTFYNDINPLTNASLLPDKYAGVYTPIMIFNNSQIAAYGAFGLGTASSPYAIYLNGSASISPLFGALNDYFFPVFAGVSIVNVTKHLIIYYNSPMSINYTGHPEYQLKAANLPLNNYLTLQVYGSSNISILNASLISGWFPSTMAGFIVGDLTVWNSTNVLVASNTFVPFSYFPGELQSAYFSSLLIYGAPDTLENDTIWGNTFPGPIIAGVNTTTGLFMDASGNLVYNNFFTEQDIAYSPNINIYTGKNATYHDYWSLSNKEPVNYTIYVNGIPLIGSIIGGGFEGGNYWGSPYITGPWNEQGYIESGYDYYPLNYFSYILFLHASGLPKGLSWQASINGVYYVSNTPYMNVSLYNDGNSSFSVYLPPGYIYSGENYIYAYKNNTYYNFTVNTGVLFSVTFNEEGLPGNSTWEVQVAGNIYASISRSITVLLPNGTYTYEIYGPYGYSPHNSYGYLNVSGSSSIISVKFTTSMYILTVSEHGLPKGTDWFIVVDGKVYYGNTSTIKILLPPGRYSIYADTIPGYSKTLSTNTIIINGKNLDVSVTYIQNRDIIFYYYIIASTAAGLIAGAAIGFYIRRKH